jgi:hypothetical protein
MGGGHSAAIRSGRSEDISDTGSWGGRGCGDRVHLPALMTADSAGLAAWIQM